MGDKITESEVDIVDDAETKKCNEDGNENMFISKKVLSTSIKHLRVCSSVFLVEDSTENNVQLVETETASQLKSFREDVYSRHH